ncbi:hypothetical protein LMG29739_06361 [Paraburkholderia solisilvae]|uniref:Uncharacterized protein n=1 Tax=Paraburkholderia solisilvae TaxID=624376 RepID=A0A6J5F5Y3_9BURK|nr:hypothetical protein LMG29739_06361 [Paraburkholderia solisilvae]
MRGAENRSEIFRVGLADIQIEQQLLHLREQFIRLVEERLIELCDIECHAWFTANNSVCWARAACLAAGSCSLIKVLLDGA